MLLDCPNVEALAQLIAERGLEALSGVNFSGATFPAVLELARAATAADAAEADVILSALRDLPEALRLYREAISIFRGQFDDNRSSDFLFSSPQTELWSVQGAASLESEAYSLFAHRFQRRLAQSGFGLRFPYALSQAMTEMAANVVHHSGAKGSKDVIGLVGYRVVVGQMNYFVGDLGRGVLRSLQENPKWISLRDEGEALVAAAKSGATRLPQHTEGDGFRVALQAFLDRSGILAMRSGDGLVTMRSEANGRNAEVSNAASVPGLRVAAYCSLTGFSGELKLCH